jgi:5-formyltetrahydrofolate cyclo-ligase
MNRLGRGRGYYDRFLAWARGIAVGELEAVGIGFSEQLVESVPVTGRDQPLDGLVFDTAVWRPPDRPF